MPQLMPLFWSLSTIMTMFLFFTVMKIYGNYLVYYVKMEKDKSNNYVNLWYW